MSTNTQRKNQNFVLFWLGVLTGALLIVAFYTLGAGESGDMLGKLRSKSYQPVQVSPYAMPTDAYKSNYGMPTDAYKSGYSMPTDAYGMPTDAYNNYGNFIVPRNFQNGLIKPSVEYKSVEYGDTQVKSSFSTKDSYGMPTDSYGMPTDNFKTSYGMPTDSYTMPTDNYSRY